MSTVPLEPTETQNTIPAPPPLEGVYGTTFANTTESVFALIGTAAIALNDPESWKNINDTSRFDPFDAMLKVVTAYELACRGVIRAHEPIFNNIPPNDEPPANTATPEGAGQ